MAPPRVPIIERALAKVRVLPNGCWEWTGALDLDGYGQIRAPGRGGTSLRVHRVVYTELVGPIPEGLDLDHACHNEDDECEGGKTCAHRRCCNPDHVEPATRGENVKRGLSGQHNARKTCCPHGHEYVGANVLIDPVHGGRRCRICRNEESRQKYLRRKAKASV